jgi:propanol-preferring alcohol dehydrogenase
MMKAWFLEGIKSLNQGQSPLQCVKAAIPQPGEKEVLIKVSTCGVCHTELDEIEGRTTPAFYPVIPGHQVVGRIAMVGPKVEQKKPGDRVGVSWFYSSCDHCQWCLSGFENLCPEFRATGRDAHGGYAEYMVAPEASTFIIPEHFSDSEAAPLLCAGAIGYRSLRLASIRTDAPIGLTGFGASAHLVLKLILHFHPQCSVFVFARNKREREFALELGAEWVGESYQQAPRLMQAIIDTTPAWTPVFDGLRQIEPGGKLIINAIRKENKDVSVLADINYPRDLWMEKSVQSVANVSRKDVQEFITAAAQIRLQPTYEEFSFAEANRAIIELKKGKIRGAKVLVVP